MIDSILFNACFNVDTELGRYISNRVANLKEAVSATSLEEIEKIAELCGEILEFYRVVEKTNLVLTNERSKKNES